MNHQDILKKLHEISNLQQKLYFEDEGTPEYKNLEKNIQALQCQISQLPMSKEKKDIYNLIVKKQKYLSDLEINQRTDDYLQPDIYNMLKQEIETTINELINFVK